jgi:hypothetical protein
VAEVAAFALVPRDVTPYPDAVTGPGRGGARWARATALALATVLISLGGHTLAGGAVHLSMPMVLGTLALGALAVAAADLRRSFVEILAVVLVAQPVLHLLASLGGHGTHASPATGMGTGMLLGHAVAAVLVSLVLAGAESAVWTLAGVLSPFRLPDAAPTCSTTPPRAVPADRSAEAGRSAFLPSGLFNRGPPVVACAS